MSLLVADRFFGIVKHNSLEPASLRESTEDYAVLPLRICFQMLAKAPIPCILLEVVGIGAVSVRVSEDRHADKFAQAVVRFERIPAQRSAPWVPAGCPSNWRVA